MGDFIRVTRYHADRKPWDVGSTVNCEVEELCLLTRGFMPTIQMWRGVMIGEEPCELESFQGMVRYFIDPLDLEDVCGWPNNKRLMEQRLAGAVPFDPADHMDDDDECDLGDCQDQFSFHACLEVHERDEDLEDRRPAEGQTHAYLEDVKIAGRFDLYIDHRVRRVVPWMNRNDRYVGYEQMVAELAEMEQQGRTSPLV